MLQEVGPQQVASRKELAITFLTLANSEYQNQRLHRPYYARIAREHGLTNQQIGEIYGITEAAVRALIKRAVQ